MDNIVEKLTVHNQNRTALVRLYWNDIVVKSWRIRAVYNGGNVYDFINSNQIVTFKVYFANMDFILNSENMYMKGGI